MARNDDLVIAQLSDIHCGDPRYDAELAEKCMRLVHAANPDVVLVPGDLTAAGYPEEYEEADRFLARLPRPWFLVPGNHDERNVGWKIYQRRFGERWGVHDLDFPAHTLSGRLRIVACDSAEPDLDDGELGRVRHRWIRDALSDADDAFKIVMLHHHLVAVPNTGRERNTVSDAGDVLATLAEREVDLVLSGHKHVPHVWQVDGMAVITSGTASTWRIRGEVPPSFNILRIGQRNVEIDVVNTTDGASRRIVIPRRSPADYRMKAEAMATIP